jgi:hypothetical protein
MLCVALALGGCVGGERIRLDAKSPPAPKHSPERQVAVSVSDDREEVKRGDKKEWYLGEAPGNRGKDLSNHQLVPLHAQLRDDLRDELKSLGFDVALESTVRKVGVSIREWHFDARTRTLRYRVEVEVFERSDGARLVQSMLADQQAIGGATDDATKTELKRAYVGVVHSLVRDNAMVLEALRR